MWKKNLNKVLIWLFLWTAIWWAGVFAKSKKWKKFFSKVKDDLSLGIGEMKKFFVDLKKKYDKKK